MKRIIDINEKIKEYIEQYIPIGGGDHVFCYPDQIVEMIANGTPIPDNATNGDVIKAMFPNIQISDSEVMKNVYTGIPYGELIGANIDCMRDWWNAPYQKDGIKYNAE